LALGTSPDKRGKKSPLGSGAGILLERLTNPNSTQRKLKLLQGGKILTNIIGAKNKDVIHSSSSDSDDEDEEVQQPRAVIGLMTSSGGMIPSLIEIGMGCIMLFPIQKIGSFEMAPINKRAIEYHST